MAHLKLGLVLFCVSMAFFARGENGSQEKKILVHGHRGSRGTHPENTLPAFEEAIEAGAEVLELDLQLSKENIPVIWHDWELHPTICRRPGITKAVPIHTLTIAEIKEFDCGSIPQPRFPDQKRIPNLSISTLQELFQWVAKQKQSGKLNRRIQYNIETKMNASNPALMPDPSLFVQIVVRLIAGAGVLEDSILQSFDFRTLRLAKKLEPRLRLSALFETKGVFCLTVHELGAQILSPKWALLTPGVVQQCHQLGIQVAPWTVNEDGQWKAMIDMGVDAIISDYPRRLLAYLASHP